MDADLDGRLGHAGEPGRFSDRQTLQLDAADRITLALRQFLKQPIEIAPGVARVGVGFGEQLGLIVQRIVQRVAHRLRPQQVDQLVARNGMRPGRKRLVGLVGVAVVVHGEQTFLDQVLQIIGPAKQTAGEKGAQVRTQPDQKRVIGSRVPIESAQEQGAQFAFGFAR